MSTPSNKPYYTFDRVIRIAITVGILYLIIILLDYLSAALIPFAIALLLAYWINPLTIFLQQWLKNRLLAVALSLLLVFSLSIGLLVLMIPTIISELVNMGELIRNYVNNSEIGAKTIAYLPNDIEKYVRDFIDESELSSYFTSDIVGQTADFVGSKVLPSVWGVFSGSVNLIIGLFGFTVVVLYLIFILLDYDSVHSGWKRFIPIRYRDIVLTIWDDVTLGMNGYFRAQALIATIVGILFAIGFSLISLPMGVLLGLLIGILNMVPYLQMVAIMPCTFFALVYALETGNSFWVMMGLIVLLFIVIQTIQDMILVPKIMGNLTGFNPAIILLSLSIWAKLLGVLGLIIALPITSILVSYYKRYLRQEELAFKQKNIELPKP